jgi:hypothetical protein
MKVMRYYFKIIFFTSAVVFLGYPYNTFSKEIFFPDYLVHGENDPNYFYERILTLALDKTKSDGDYTFKKVTTSGGTARLYSMLLNSQELDIIWGDYRPTDSENLITVNFNLVNGLNNYRALLIKRNRYTSNKTYFNKKNRSQLSYGAFKYSRDADILKRIGYKFSTSLDVNLLLKMLNAGRFDCLVVGAQDAQYLVESNKAFDLMVLPDYMFMNDAGDFTFFLDKHNIQLSQRISRGLAFLLKDGAFEAEFRSNPSFMYAFEMKQTTEILNLPDIE